MERIRVDLVIIGGGANGLAAAYYLCRRGMRNIVVLEKGYIGCGASGRCGAGIRQQWGLEENIILARESVRIFSSLSQELGFNIFFRQGGYLMLIHDEQELALISRTVPLQNRLGVPTRILEPKRISKLVPGINLEGILAGAFCPTDGTAYPYAVLWAFARQARKMGARILTGTEVSAVEKKNGGFEVTTAGRIFSAPRILNVAGAWTRRIAAMVGVEIPTKPCRHEIAVTEPIKPFLGPMVISVKKGFYFSQTMRGEIVGGIGDDEEAPSFDTGSSFQFLLRYASALKQTMPPLGKLKIIRQWAGLYDMTPDARPIIGTVEGVEGYYHACGFSGHGFMLSPVVAKLLSELITTGRTSLPISGLSLSRFAEPGLTRDPYVVG